MFTYFPSLCWVKLDYSYGFIIISLNVDRSEVTDLRVYISKRRRALSYKLTSVKIWKITISLKIGSLIITGYKTIVIYLIIM